MFSVSEHRDEIIFVKEIKTKPRLVIVINSIDFFISHRNYLAFDAAEAGFDVFIIYTLHKSADLKNLINKGVNLVQVPLFSGNINPLKEIAYLFQTFKILRNLNCEILHLISIKPIIYGGIFSQFFHKHQPIFAFSGLGYLFEKRTWRIRELFTLRRLLVFISLLLLKLAIRKKNSKFIFQNESDKNLILTLFGLNDSNCLIFPGSGVSTKDFKLRKENKNTQIVLMASRLLKSKGVVEFISAANILRGFGLNYEFILVGDFDQNNPSSISEKELESLNKNQVVKVVGFFEDLRPLLYSCNLFVLPSYREGLPKVLLEAAAIGRAVITTNVPGCRDAIIPNQTGLIVEPKNSEALAISIFHLMTDEKKRLKFGSSGRKLVEAKFKSETVSKLHMQLYFSVLKTTFLEK